MRKTYEFKFLTAKRVTVKELCHVKKNSMQLDSISKQLESVEDLILTFGLLSDHATLLNSLFQLTSSLASLTLFIDNGKNLATKTTLSSFISSLPTVPSLHGLTSLSLNSPQRSFDFKEVQIISYFIELCSQKQQVTRVSLDSVGLQNERLVQDAIRGMQSIRVLECIQKAKNDMWLAKWIRCDRQLRKAKLSLNSENLLNACIENLSLQ